MKEIMIKDKISSKFAVSYEMAEKCFPEIKESMEVEGSVVLNFKGVSIISSPFLSGTIGLLVKDYPVEKIKEKVKLINLPEGVDSTISLVLKNSASFYK